jgi:hypothetical protein
MNISFNIFLISWLNIYRRKWRIFHIKKNLSNRILTNLYILKLLVGRVLVVCDIFRLNLFLFSYGSLSLLWFPGVTCWWPPLSENPTLPFFVFLPQYLLVTCLFEFCFINPLHRRIISNSILNYLKITFKCQILKSNFS